MPDKARFEVWGETDTLEVEAGGWIVSIPIREVMFRADDLEEVARRINQYCGHDPDTIERHKFTIVDRYE